MKLSNIQYVKKQNFILSIQDLQHLTFKIEYTITFRLTYLLSTIDWYKKKIVQLLAGRFQT